MSLSLGAVDGRDACNRKDGLLQGEQALPDLHFHIKDRFRPKLTSDSWQIVGSLITCHKTASGLDVPKYSHHETSAWVTQMLKLCGNMRLELCEFGPKFCWVSCDCVLWSWAELPWAGAGLWDALRSNRRAFLRAKCCSEYGDPWLTLPDIVSVLHIHRLMLFRDWQSSLSNLIFTDAFGLLRVVLVGCCLFFFSMNCCVTSSHPCHEASISKARLSALLRGFPFCLGEVATRQLFVCSSSWENGCGPAMDTRWIFHGGCCTWATRQVSAAAPGPARRWGGKVALGKFCPGSTKVWRLELGHSLYRLEDSPKSNLGGEPFCPQHTTPSSARRHLSSPKAGNQIIDVHIQPNPEQ